MARPRALVVATTYPARPGDGTPAFVADLCAELAVDFDVTVVVPRVSGAPLREVTADGSLTVVRHRYFLRRFESVADGAILENVRARKSSLLQVPFLIASQWLAVRREARDFAPDAIHAHWLIPAGVSARGLAKRAPLVVTTLGGDLYALRGGLPTRLKRRVVAAATVVTVMNADMAAVVRSLGGTDVRVMPMGARFSVVTTVPAPGPVRLLAVGRLVEKKGFDVLLAALADVPDAVLTIVGDGPDRAGARSGGGRPWRARHVRWPTGSRGPRRRVRQCRHRGVSIAARLVRRPGRTARGDARGDGIGPRGDRLGFAWAQRGSRRRRVRGARARGRRPALATALGELAGNQAKRRALGAAAAVRAGNYSLESVGASYRRLHCTR